MPIKPKDSRLVGFNRVKPRLQRLPKTPPIPRGTTLAKDTSNGTELSYNPPASSPNPLVTPTPFLPKHLRELTHEVTNARYAIPPPLTKPREGTFLNPTQIDEIKELRASGQSAHSIARKFSTTSLFVSLVAPLSKTSRQEKLTSVNAHKASWSERKQAFAQVRQLKRASWGMG